MDWKEGLPEESGIYWIVEDDEVPYIARVNVNGSYWDADILGSDMCLIQFDFSSCVYHAGPLTPPAMDD